MIFLTRFDYLNAFCIAGIANNGRLILIEATINMSKKVPILIFYNFQSIVFFYDCGSYIVRYPPISIKNLSLSFFPYKKFLYFGILLDSIVPSSENALLLQISKFGFFVFKNLIIFFKIPFTKISSSPNTHAYFPVANSIDLLTFESRQLYFFKEKYFIYLLFEYPL